MADTLRTRVSRVMAGSLHALIDKLENQLPEAVMEQSLREADGVIDEVRHELGRVSANRHLTQQRHAQLNEQHGTLAGQIDQAFAAQREELARAAVARQLDIEAQLPVLEASLAELARQEAELQGFVAALLAKKREMDEALAALRKSRAAAASALTPSGSAGAGQRMEAVTGAFDRVYERQTGLTATSRQQGLQQTAQLQALDELVRENKINERLAQLKAAQG
jgi:phage shock protein A